MANKVRKVDLSPDEFLVGIAGMTPEEIAVYTVSIMLQYSSGGEIPWDDARMMRVINARPTRLRKAAAALIARGKLSANGEKVVNKRVINELKAASSRIENAEKAARIRWEKENGIQGNQSDTDAPASNVAVLSLTPPSSPSPSNDYGQEFDEVIWPASWTRGNATNPRKPAREKYIRLRKAGVASADVIAGMRAYAANPASRAGTEYAKQLVTWLNAEMWKDATAGAPKPPAMEGVPAAWSEDEARWLMRLKGTYWMKHQWGPKDINDPDCKIPRHVYEHWVASTPVGPLVIASQQVLRRA